MPRKFVLPDFERIVQKEPCTSVAKITIHEPWPRLGEYLRDLKAELQPALERIPDESCRRDLLKSLGQFGNPAQETDFEKYRRQVMDGQAQSAAQAIMNFPKTTERERIDMIVDNERAMRLFEQQYPRTLIISGGATALPYKKQTRSHINYAAFVEPDEMRTYIRGDGKYESAAQQATRGFMQRLRSKGAPHMYKGSIILFDA